METFVTGEFIKLYGLETYEYFKDSKDIINHKVMDNLTQQAMRESLLKCMKNRLHLYFEDYLDSEEFQKAFPIFKEVKEKAEKINTRFIFLTVNPEPSITLNYFRDVINKAINKKWMINYLYVIEQRGDNEDSMGRGFHAHFIIDTDGKKRHEIIRELKNTFKKVCDISSNCIFNVRNIKEEHLKRFLGYILSMKNQKFKHDKQKIDKRFREINHIANYYGIGDLLKMAESHNEEDEDFEYNF